MCSTSLPFISPALLSLFGFRSCYLTSSAELLSLFSFSFSHPAWASFTFMLLNQASPTHHFKTILHSMSPVCNAACWEMSLAPSPPSIAEDRTRIIFPLVKAFCEKCFQAEEAALASLSCQYGRLCHGLSGVSSKDVVLLAGSMSSRIVTGVNSFTNMKWNMHPCQ